MVQRFQVQDRRFRVGQSEVTDAQFLGVAGNVREELAVGFWAVGPELVQDFGQGGVGHGDLEEMVKEGDLSRVSTRLLNRWLSCFRAGI